MNHHPTRHYGIVKFFSRVKGWGFIVPDNGGPDVYVHYTDIVEEGYRNLYADDRVEFDLVDHGRGPKAVCVFKLRN